MAASLARACAAALLRRRRRPRDDSYSDESLTEDSTSADERDPSADDALAAAIARGVLAGPPPRDAGALAVRVTTSAQVPGQIRAAAAAEEEGGRAEEGGPAVNLEGRGSAPVRVSVELAAVHSSHSLGVAWLASDPSSPAPSFSTPSSPAVPVQASRGPGRPRVHVSFLRCGAPAAAAKAPTPMGCGGAVAFPGPGTGGPDAPAEAAAADAAPLLTRLSARASWWAPAAGAARP